ncbi:MAG: acyltransferase [Patescibacteria group bacterium]
MINEKEILQPKKETNRSYLFDILRIFACGIVYIWHNLQMYHIKDDVHKYFSYTIKTPAKTIFTDFYYTLVNLGFLNLGYIGVGIFFMLSGYFITQSVQNSTNAKVFISKRLMRILPSILIASLLILTIQKLHLENLGVGYIFDIKKLVLNILLIHDFFPPTSSIDPAWWTLLTEIKYYLVTFILFRQFGQKREKMFLYKYAFFVLAYILTIKPLLQNYPTNVSAVLNSIRDSLILIPIILTGEILFILRTSQKNNKIYYIFVPFCLITYALMESSNIFPGFMLINQENLSRLISVIMGAFLFIIVFLISQLKTVSMPKLVIVFSVLSKISLVTFQIYLIHQVMGHIFLNYLLLGFRLEYWLSQTITFTIILIFAFSINQISKKMIKFFRIFENKASYFFSFSKFL